MALKINESTIACVTTLAMSFVLLIVHVHSDVSDIESRALFPGSVNSKAAKPSGSCCFIRYFVMRNAKKDRVTRTSLKCWQKQDETPCMGV